MTKAEVFRIEVVKLKQKLYTPFGTIFSAVILKQTFVKLYATGRHRQLSEGSFV